MTAYVYMIRCSNGALYTGWTNNLEKRVAAHKKGQGAKYTRAFHAQSLAYYEIVPDKEAALRREHAIKQLPKIEKEAMATQFAKTAMHGIGEGPA